MTPQLAQFAKQIIFLTQQVELVNIALQAPTTLLVLALTAQILIARLALHHIAQFARLIMSYTQMEFAPFALQIRITQVALARIAQFLFVKLAHRQPALLATLIMF